MVKASIQRLVNKVKTLDYEFSEYHYTIMELQENKAGVDEQQAMLDDHDEKVSDLIDRLQHLVSEPKEGRSPSAIADPSRPLHVQLDTIEKQIRM